jgi:phosphoribosylamine-glycine ligase
MKWLAKRFWYTRQLEMEIRVCHTIWNQLEEEIMALRTRRTEFSKMSLDELEEVLSACVDYQRCLVRLGVGDPVQNRVLPIFEKYNIVVERNTATDALIEEAKMYAEQFEQKREHDD